MSLCDRENFLEDMKRLDEEDNKEDAKKEFEELITGERKEIKYVKGDEIYEELYDEYSKEYDLKREENKWWGITITKEKHERTI